ncbi:MAG: hypothetical protein JWL64_1912 [Frankiales bacterium]|nr:hypothetical protein [Frankiales bacterium]
MKRTPRLLVVGALSALALTGCGSGPSLGGAAAVVGDGAVSMNTIKHEVQRVSTDPAASKAAADLPALQTELLDTLVQLRVAEQAADDAGVSVTQSEVDAQLADLADQNGGQEQLAQAAWAAGFSPDLLRTLARTQALRVALGDALTADVPVSQSDLKAAYDARIGDFDQVRLVHLPLPTLAEAQALLPEAQGLDNAAFAAFVAQKAGGTATAQAAGPVGPLGLSQFEQAQESAYGAAAFAARPGDTFAVAGPSGAYLARLISHDVTSLSEATPSLRRTILAEQIDAATNKAFSAVEVRINPRLGSWDEQQHKVLARGKAGGRQLSVIEGGNPDPTAEPSPPAP